MSDIKKLRVALAEARNVIAPFADKLTELEDDGDYPPIERGEWMYIGVNESHLRRARNWQRRHGESAT